jgi:phosphoglycolate phosphatase
LRILLPEADPTNEDLLSSLDVHERSGVEAAGGILFEGVAEGLAALSQVFPLYLVSNCKDWYLRAFLSFTGLGGLFTECDCHGSSGMDKDGMLTSLVTRRGLASPVYVGDTDGDRASAEAAGIPFAFASYGYGEIQSSELSFAGFAELAAHFLAE